MVSARWAGAAVLLQLGPWLASADPTIPPDTSLARLPIAYYGSQSVHHGLCGGEIVVQ